MPDVRSQIDRMRRGWAGTRGRDVASRVHLVLVGLAFVGAFGSRVLGPWPGFSALERRWLETLAVALLLFLLAPLLARLVALALRPSRRGLARRLDDALGWRDAADTALALQRDGATQPLEDFHLAQTTGRLRALEPARLWPRRRDARWLRHLLLLAFVFVLLAPGVEGLLGTRGAGRGTRAGLGSRPEDEGRAPARPLPADLWLLTFVEEPLPVEPLPAETGNGAGR